MCNHCTCSAFVNIYFLTFQMWVCTNCNSNVFITRTMRGFDVVSFLPWVAAPLGVAEDDLLPLCVAALPGVADDFLPLWVAGTAGIVSRVVC